MISFLEYLAEVKKTGECPTCGDGAIFDACYSDDGKPEWKCRCCDKTSTRQVKTTVKKQARLANKSRLDATFQKLIKK